MEVSSGPGGDCVCTAGHCVCSRGGSMLAQEHLPLDTCSSCAKAGISCFGARAVGGIKGLFGFGGKTRCSRWSK
jgi:hypothetical protein